MSEKKKFKISPDVEADEDVKVYPENEEKMINMFYGDIDGKGKDDEEEVDEEIVDDGKGEENFESDDEEVVEDEGDDEEDEEEDEDENVEPPKKSEKKVAKKEKKSDIEDDGGFEKESAIAKIDELTKQNKQLETEVNKLRAATNVLTELGINPENPQQDILNGLKDVQMLVQDFKNMPELVDVIGKVYNEGLGVVDTQKTPQDFMPEGEFFYQEDAFKPGSDSATAYRKYQMHLNNQETAKNKFLERLKASRKTQDEIMKGIKSGEEILNKALSDTKIKALNTFDVDDKVWNEFMKAFGEVDENILYGAFMGYASAKGMKPKALKKIKSKKNVTKDKDQKITKSKSYSNRDYDFDNEQVQAYEKLFGVKP